MAETIKNNGVRTLRLPLTKLILDPNNFRLVHEKEQINISEDLLCDKDIMKRTYRLLVGDKNQNIKDLIDSFTSNGYLPVDHIQVRKIDDNNYLVVEGNRRVATLLFLKNEHKLKNIYLDKLDPENLKRVPVVLYEDKDEVHHSVIMALNHIGGKRKWPEWNQAKLLEDLVVKHKLSEEEVFKRVGIRKTELRRSLRALALANQYIDSDYGDEFKESMFPIFREVARNIPVKNWLELNPGTNIAENEKNREMFFSLLSHEPIEDIDDDDLSNGYNGETLEPAIIKRDDIVSLSKIIEDSKAMNILIENRSISDALRSSNVIFKERISSALKSVVTDIDTLAQLSITQDQVPNLEEALGKLRTIVEKARGNDLLGVDNKSLYFDRIDNHFSSIEIKKYRCLNDISVNKISRINLFAGVNNSGKTTLLEAIYLLCKQNDFNGILDIYRRRGKIPENNISPKWLSEQLHENILLNATFDNKKSTVEIEPYYDEGHNIDRARYLKTVDISTNYDDLNCESTSYLFSGRDRTTQADSIKQLCNVVFSSPFFFNEPHHYTSYYHKSVQSKLLPKIEKFIKEKVISTIEDIRLVDEFQRFLVNDDRFEESMDLTSYGEGFQRILFTSLLFASAQNGIVLIDEFENAIHTDLLEIFVPFIYELSKEFNVQVFLTSHSKECIDSFVKSIVDIDYSEISFHALINNDDSGINIKEFEGREFYSLLEAGDVDLRRAR